MKNIVIIGAGDLGREIVWLIEDINRRKPTYLILGFLDDDVLKVKAEFYGYKVLDRINGLERLNKRIPFSAVLAIQDSAVREKIVLEHPSFNKWESSIHPTAVIAPSSQTGKGCVVFPQVTISVDTKIGDFGLCYIRSTICNDCMIGDFVSLMTGATVSEHAQIGKGSYLAAGSCIYPHRTIGERVKVGVEATVCKDYGDGAEVNERGSGFQLFK